MDRIVEMIVRSIGAIAGFARLIPGIDYAEHVPGEPLKILLVGYNGARNTGSDVRVASLAKQIESLAGNAVELSLMTLDASSTQAYFDESVRQIQFSTLFFGDLLKACSEHHAAILCEGSTFKSKFADALTLYSCEAAGIMRAQGKLCIAYGSEVGDMEPYLRRAVRDMCSDVRYAVRSAGSLETLRTLGFDGFPGTDTAWDFDSTPGNAQAHALLREAGWDGARPLLGIAPVNPFCWPVKPSFLKLASAVACGDRALQYQGLYFFSWSEDRERKFHAYLDALAQACATFALERGMQPVVFGMEQLDGQACALLAERLERMGLASPLLLSSERDGFVMAAALRSLSLLVTSRYHAQVLATGALVPAVAVSMDERLANLAEELQSDSRLLLQVDDQDLAPRLLLAMDFAYENADAIRQQLNATL
ncbi:MAG: hypothetical protein IJ087_04340, partial [Eggerthellaceae bacterium]|nr:hypothetical protein [Eggerthellaceae bacterium]